MYPIEELDTLNAEFYEEDILVLNPCQFSNLPTQLESPNLSPVNKPMRETQIFSLAVKPLSDQQIKRSYSRQEPPLLNSSSSFGNKNLQNSSIIKQQIAEPTRQ
jgi:hypothetical protein